MESGRLGKIRKLAGAARRLAAPQTRLKTFKELDCDARVVIADDEPAMVAPPPPAPEPTPAPAPAPAPRPPPPPFRRVLCFPTSIIESVQTNELQLLLIAQLCRVVALHRVNCIVVLEDHGYRKGSDAFSPSEFIAKVMSYLETPQYLRKRLFPLSPALRNIGYAAPLDCAHHLRETELSEFREGAVERRPLKEGEGSWADIGLGRPCKLDVRLEEGTRVTVQIEEFMFANRKSYRGKAVGPDVPQRRAGLYWGYSVEVAPTFSALFEVLAEDCLKVLLDADAPRCSPAAAREAFAVEVEARRPSEVLLCFTGRGLRGLFESDEKTKLTLEGLRARFPLALNPLCAGAGVRSLYLPEQIGYFCAKLFD